jgi:hypothetical protein
MRDSYHTLYQLALILYTIIAITVGGIIGWYVHLHTVTSHCDKLGGFYISDTVYYCGEQINFNSKDTGEKKHE